MKNLIHRIGLLPCFFWLLSYTAFSQTSQRPIYNNNNLYAGIEVGSKGVKMSVIEMDKNARTKGSFNIVKDTSVNTDFISFTPSSFSATLKGLHGLYQTAQTVYGLPAGRIFTVISSGVKMQADKENKQSDILSLVDSFRLIAKEPGRKVEVVDVTDEARLSHLGIVPDARRYTTFLLDIGSGNTKGGFFPFDNTSNFRLFQLNWGTKSTANATTKRCEGNTSLENYSKQLGRVLASIENGELIYAVNSSGAYPMSDNIAFSGGIAWAVATLARPELTGNPIVTLSYEDLKKFTDKLEQDFSSLSPQSLSATIRDEGESKAAFDEITRVHKVFDQQSLMAGAGLLLRIMRQFESVYSSKNYYLVKNGQVGWISAYVTESVNPK